MKVDGVFSLRKLSRIISLLIKANHTKKDCDHEQETLRMSLAYTRTYYVVGLARFLHPQEVSISMVAKVIVIVTLMVVVILNSTDKKDFLSHSYLII